MRASSTLPVALVLVVGLSGCFSLLDEHSDTKLRFFCLALSPGQEPDWTVDVWGAAPEDIEPAEARLAEQLALLSGRTAVVVQPRAANVELGNEPTLEALRVWAEDLNFRDRHGLHLHVLWVPVLPLQMTGFEAAPGVIVLSSQAAYEGANFLERPVADIASALLLHHAGHALGLVNAGVPVQNPAIQEREEPAHHAPNPSAVMHSGWELVRTMEWHGPYAYAVDDRADWAGARSGVCA